MRAFSGFRGQCSAWKRLQIGSRRRVDNKDGAGPGFVSLGGALFALLGLLFAFSFSGAAGRFETKRHLTVEEANPIETDYLRIELPPATAQPVFRQKFPEYLDARLAVYDKLSDIGAARTEMLRAEALHKQIWIFAVAACQEKKRYRDNPTTPFIHQRDDRQQYKPYCVASRSRAGDHIRLACSGVPDLFI